MIAPLSLLSLAIAAARMPSVVEPSQDSIISGTSIVSGTSFVKCPFADDSSLNIDAAECLAKAATMENHCPACLGNVVVDFVSDKSEDELVNAIVDFLPKGFSKETCSHAAGVRRLRTAPEALAKRTRRLFMFMPKKFGLWMMYAVGLTLVYREYSYGRLRHEMKASNFHMTVNTLSDVMPRECAEILTQFKYDGMADSWEMTRVWNSFMKASGFRTHQEFLTCLSRYPEMRGTMDYYLSQRRHTHSSYSDWISSTLGLSKSLSLSKVSAS